jgi:AraC-like DNA-binding protein
VDIICIILYIYLMKTALVTPADMIRAFLDPKCRVEMKTQGRVVCGRDWTLGPRAIPQHLIYYLESGALAGTISGRDFRLDPERVFWLQPGVRHQFALHSTGDEARVFFFRFYAGRNRPLRLAENYLVFPPDPSLKIFFAEMLHEENTFGKMQDTGLRSRLGLLSCRLFSAGNGHKKGKPGLQKYQQLSAAAFIRENIGSRFTLAHLAAHLGLNPDYCSRQFKRSFGLTPQAWIKRERIKTAASYLLESPLTATQAAEKLGYDDIYFFSRQFKEVMGVSPRQWRNRSSQTG